MKNNIFAIHNPNCLFILKSKYYMSEDDFESFCREKTDDVIDSILKDNKEKDLITFDHILSALKDLLIQKYYFDELAYAHYSIPYNNVIVHTELDNMQHISKYLSKKNINKIEKYNRLVIGKILDKLN